MDSSPETLPENSENKNPNPQIPSQIAKDNNKESIPDNIEESKLSDLPNPKSPKEDQNSAEGHHSAGEEDELSTQAGGLDDSRALSPSKQRNYAKASQYSKRKKDRTVKFKETSEPLTERASKAAKKGATTMTAIAIGKSTLHASFSMMFTTCQVVLSSNKKKALSKVIPGLALALIPGVGLLAGIAMGIGSSWLGEKVYNSVLSSRTVGVDYRIFLPDKLLCDIDEKIAMLSVKIQQMSSPYYELRDELLAAVLKADRTLDEDIQRKFESIKFDIDGVKIENNTVEETVDKIMEVTRIVEEWFDDICKKLERLEEEIEMIVAEDEERLYDLQDCISEKFDDLIEVMTKDLPNALKDGLKHMDDTLKQVKV